ncbi:MAG: hypothetical protein IPK35_16550 [Saprospiraceae bacterium]|jgi:hypothetical protein|nr:hypothetical protein [Saprospiraceae bacterium]
MKNTDSILKIIGDFENGVVTNRVIKYVNTSSKNNCIFVPNWRAKPHHWDGFCNFLAQFSNLDYFETREKPSTKCVGFSFDQSNEKTASDVVCYINSINNMEYHLILCSFSAPLVFSQWDKIHNKPKSLILICPIQRVMLPWPVRLFSSLPQYAFPLLYKMTFNLANRTKAVKAICNNHQDLFREGNMDKLIKFQSSVKEVLKLRVSFAAFEKTAIPTLVFKPLNDKVHCPKVCQKIHNSIKDSKLLEVENFRLAHSVDVAKKINEFIHEQNLTDAKSLLTPI